jgi:uncharacterized damage-inducible protein DinB
LSFYWYPEKYFPVKNKYLNLKIIIMETQISTSTVYIDLLAMQAGIFHNAFDGIKDSDALIRPNEQVNHINWLLGHLATCRFMLFNLLGGKEPDPNFNFYFKTISDELPYPSLNEIKKTWVKASSLLNEKIGSFSDDELISELPGKGGSVKDFISFFVYHEAYHLGQIGYARKYLGLPPLKSN